MNASALTVARSLKAHEVLAALKRAIAERGIPGHIRSDNGPEFIAGITRQYLSENGIKTLYIEPGSPWQNGHVKSFHNRLRDECLNQEWVPLAGRGPCCHRELAQKVQSNPPAQPSGIPFPRYVCQILATS